MKIRGTATTASSSGPTSSTGSADGLIDLIERERPTSFSAVLAIHNMLAALPRNSFRHDVTAIGICESATVSAS
ncbi:hypothetical protein GFS60_04967 [Rhodococcus sp. WAY2]|nr:hypothetical protein GFS60_04967 [Rhodococcus sp. WAY2]